MAVTATYRADQIGSLLRPPELLEARAAYSAGRIGLSELREAEDRAILLALELQKQVGIGIYTDGEYRRSLFYSDLIDAVEGFVPDETVLQEWRGPDGEIQTRSMIIVGSKLRQTRRLAEHEASFLRQHSPGPFKITLPSPVLFLERYKQGITDRFYPTRSDLFQEIAGLINREIKALIDEGVKYIQIDAPTYSHFIDTRLRQRLRARGADPDQLLDEAIAADNACLEDVKREGVTLAIHFCRGNSGSRWLAEGGYDPIAEKLFGSLQVDRFLLEYDSPRAGGFEPLRFVPRGKTVVLGLITTKEARLESQDELLRRIDEASKYVPISDLGISPQCGFASSMGGNLISWDDQRRKLELVVDTARKVWG